MGDGKGGWGGGREWGSAHTTWCVSWAWAARRLNSALLIFKLKYLFLCLCFPSCFHAKIYNFRCPFSDLTPTFIPIYIMKGLKKATPIRNTHNWRAYRGVLALLPRVVKSSVLKLRSKWSLTFASVDKMLHGVTKEELSLSTFYYAK